MDGPPPSVPNCVPKNASLQHTTSKFHDLVVSKLFRPGVTIDEVMSYMVAVLKRWSEIIHVSRKKRKLIENILQNMDVQSHVIEDRSLHYLKMIFSAGDNM